MAKTVNYTPEMEKAIREAFAGEVDHKAAVSELAATLGRSVASVRQKAVRMGLYKKAKYVGKNGAKPETKEAMVSEIAELLEVNSEVVESLAKATKRSLELIREAIRGEADEGSEG